MGAGAVVYRMHTRNMNEMGGLAQLMPWTGLIFLIGALSVSAIPPLNGFVSEWFLYQSLFIGSTVDPGILKFFGPIFAMLLGLVGAMVAMCFVKAYGTTFTGLPRSEHAKQVSEVPGSMLAGMGILALGAIFLGLGAPMITPIIGKIAASLANVPAGILTNGIQVFPMETSQAVLSTPFIFILLAGLLTIPLLVVLLLGGFSSGHKSVTEPWACGYGYSPQMGVSASNFAQPMRAAYQPLYRIRSLIQKPLNDIAAFSKKVSGVFLVGAEPVIERTISQPITATVKYLGKRIQSLQMGDLRMYCLYIFIALVVLLIVIFR